MTLIAFLAVFAAGLGFGAITVIIIATYIDETRDARLHAKALKNLRESGIEFTEITTVKN